MKKFLKNLRPTSTEPIGPTISPRGWTVVAEVLVVVVVVLVVVVVVVVVAAAAAVVVTLAVVVVSLRMILCAYIVGFSRFLKRHSGPTNLGTDGPTDRPSYRGVRTHSKTL